MHRLIFLTIVACGLIASGLHGADAPADAFDPEPVVSLFELLVDSAETNADTVRQCLTVLTAKVQSRELSDQALAALRPRMQPLLTPILAKADHPLFADAALLSASWGDAAGLKAARAMLESTKQPQTRRIQALDALITAGDKSIGPVVTVALSQEPGEAASADNLKWRAAVLSALGRSDSPQVAEIVLAAYSKLDSELQPKAIELLTQRVVWSKALLKAIGENKIPTTALNANQVAKLLASRDEELVKLVTTKWGTVRTDRNPQREQVIAEVRTLLNNTPGDPHAGEKVFKNLCSQCHKIHGEGHDVGPDITLNGRNSFDQLLSNVLDPSLVIGGSYQARTVITGDGRSLTGLLVEDNEQRVVLKMQGGKVETIARDDVDELIVSQLSMMPEGIEKQYKPQEIADLFAFLSLDKHPSDASAKLLPGAPTPRK